MKPGTLNIEIMQGDTFDDLFITIPNLTSRGGPANLTNSAVRAQVRRNANPTSELYAEFDVEILDATTGRVRPKLTSDQTEMILRNGWWDLQVEDQAQDPVWVGTVLHGKAGLIKEVTAQ